MDVSTKNTLAALGMRIRKARLERGMTQEVLAGPEFTKGYVSALERGAVRPSLKALDVFARRLNIPIADFLVARLDTDTPPELDALQEDLTYQFNYAKMLIRSDSTDEALKLLATAETGAQLFMPKLPARIRYRIPFLRGLAYLQRSEPDLARPELERALEITEKDGDAEASATVRNMLGVALYQQGQPQLALEYHTQCLRAVQNKEVKDLNLRLSIYRNLANDHWALNDTQQALRTYKDALDMLDDVNDLHRQATIFWDIATAYKAKGDWARAKLYATRALHIHEAADNRGEAAAISMNMAELMMGDSKYDEAERLLNKAEGLLSNAGDKALLSNLYHNYADLARQRGDLDQAARHAEESVKLSEALKKSAGKGKQAQGSAQRTYAEALQVAALIEEKRNNTKEADRLFNQAIEAIEQTSFDETIYSLTFSYAQVLEERGDHKQAMEYYRRAAQAHQRPSRLGS
jgi:tetratricopeptide (TPR) repeat protein